MWLPMINATRPRSHSAGNVRRPSASSLPASSFCNLARTPPPHVLEQSRYVDDSFLSIRLPILIWRAINRRWFSVTRERHFSLSVRRIAENVRWISVSRCSTLFWMMWKTCDDKYLELIRLRGRKLERPEMAHLSARAVWIFDHRTRNNKLDRATALTFYSKI